MAEDQDEPVTAREQDIQAVSRTAQILGLFGPDTPELSVAEATRRLGLKRTTVQDRHSCGFLNDAISSNQQTTINLERPA